MLLSVGNWCASAEFVVSVAGYVTKCLLSPDMQKLATVSSDKTIKLWNIDGFTLDRTLTGGSPSRIPETKGQDFGSGSGSCGFRSRKLRCTPTN